MAEGPEVQRAGNLEQCKLLQWVRGLLHGPFYQGSRVDQGGSARLPGGCPQGPQESFHPRLLADVSAAKVMIERYTANEDTATLSTVESQRRKLQMRTRAAK